MIPGKWPRLGQSQTSFQGHDHCSYNKEMQEQFRNSSQQGWCWEFNVSCSRGSVLFRLLHSVRPFSKHGGVCPAFREVPVHCPQSPGGKSGSDLIQGTAIFLGPNDRSRGQTQALNILKFKNQHFDRFHCISNQQAFCIISQQVNVLGFLGHIWILSQLLSSATIGQK